jgi:hypothetical protein
MPRKTKLVMFYLNSTEPRAILAGRNDSDEGFVVEMKQRPSGLWAAQVELGEGTYRCRYYCGNENNLLYYGPAHAGGGAEDGLDAVVSVAPSAKTPAEYFHLMSPNAAWHEDASVLCA